MAAMWVIGVIIIWLNMSRSIESKFGCADAKECAHAADSAQVASVTTLLVGFGILVLVTAFVLVARRRR